MKNLVFIVVLLGAIILALGYFLGWFSFSTSSEGEKTQINLTIDKEKINQDKEKAEKKIKDFTEDEEPPKQ